MPKDFLDLSKRQQYNRLNKTLADCDDNLLAESECDDILCDESDYDDFLDDSDNVSVGSNTEVNHDCADQPNYAEHMHTGRCESSVDEMETDNEPSSQFHHDDKPQPFQDKIISWAIQFGVPRNAVSSLLKILRGHACFADLPADSRTLINTPKSTELRSVPPGNYRHFGLAKGILRALDLSNVDITPGQQHALPSIPPSVKVFINIDGIPLTKSSNSQFWSILGALDPLSVSTPFTIGVYHGTKKTTVSETFLHDFVSEAKVVLKEGILIGNRTLLVELKGFICDAPARAFIKCIKGHTGYFGCEKCTQEGEYFSNRVVFPEVNCHLRSDEDFRLRDHHLGTSLLESLDIKMVTKFPYEYMHLVCLGVMRKLVFAWLRGKLSVRLSARVVDELCSLLEMLAPFICREFARKPRTVREIDRFKATEWRQLLLYTGPVVLRKVLPTKMFIHFLALHCAITILVTPGLAVDLNAYANSLLCSFVENANVLYGLEFMSYNVHGLVHLANDVKEFGELDSFSGFPFENHLQKLKRYVRKSNRPLQQLCNRLIEHEKHSSRLDQPGLRRNVSTSTPLLAKSGKHLTLRDFTLTTADNDNCCILTDSSVIVISSFLQEGQESFVVGRKFLLLQDLYTSPMKSSLLGIVLVSNISSVIEKWSTHKIQAKAVRLPFKNDSDSDDNKFAVFPLRHTS